MSTIITLGNNTFEELAITAATAAGSRDSGEPAEQIFKEKLVDISGGPLFSTEQWSVLKNHMPEPEAWLLEEVIPAFFEHLDQQDIAFEDEELAEQYEPFFLGENGEMLLFVAVLRNKMKEIGVTLKVEGIKIPKCPPLDSDE
jgi:hypothetical protein